MKLERDSGQLSQRLREWHLDVPRNPDFRARVRARIASDFTVMPWPQFARRHAAVVAAVLLLAFAGGAAGGRGWAKARDAALSVRLAEEYVGGLDARLVARR